MTRPAANPVLEALGITELQLQQLMADAARRKTYLVEVEHAVMAKADEIASLLRSGEITQDTAHGRWESEVLPHLGLRPGRDYDPRNDIVELIPKRRVSSLA